MIAAQACQVYSSVLCIGNQDISTTCKLIPFVIFHQ